MLPNDQKSQHSRASDTKFVQDFFYRKTGVTLRLLEDALLVALRSGADFAEVYLEHEHSTSLGFEEGRVTIANEGSSLGCGIRATQGDAVGYAFTEDLSWEALNRTAMSAALISQKKNLPRPTEIIFRAGQPAKSLYLDHSPSVDTALQAKVEMLVDADRAARSYNSRIKFVQAGFADELKHILILNSEGLLVSDLQPLAKLSVSVLAFDGAKSGRGSAGGGGRVPMDFFAESSSPVAFACEASRQAIVQLEATPMPAGDTEVVLGPGWPGILIHEAVGHGLEADFVARRSSAFTSRLGQIVGNSRVNIVDNGTLPYKRGSLNIDDEGTPTTETLLIEKGVLRNYMNDRLSAKTLKLAFSGNARRQSYRHPPMPRMTNTYMLPGEDTPEDIVRSVRKGLYVRNVGGGQVDIVNGTFMFSTSEAYLIESGKIAAPVRNATLIGDGLSTLKQVTMVGHDLSLDLGIGTCAKEGQSVPVCVGMPTVKLSSMTVGGTVN